MLAPLPKNVLYFPQRRQMGPTRPAAGRLGGCLRPPLPACTPPVGHPQTEPLCGGRTGPPFIPKSDRSQTQTPHRTPRRHARSCVGSWHRTLGAQRLLADRAGPGKSRGALRSRLWGVGQEWEVRGLSLPEQGSVLGTRAPSLNVHPLWTRGRGRQEGRRRAGGTSRGVDVQQAPAEGLL